MEDLLVVILQFLFELVLNVLVNVFFDWPWRSRRTPEPMHIAWRGFWWFVVGCMVGGVSLPLLPYTLIRIGALRVLNLVVAPLIAASLSQAVARRRSETNANVIARNHYWQAFWFTVGLGIIRFAYATRV
jgi:hypothetical protein